MPVLRNLAYVGFNGFDSFSTREAVLHEPFPVQQSGHLLENLDPPLVILDETLDGIKCTCNLHLSLDIRKSDSNRLDPFGSGVPDL